MRYLGLDLGTKTLGLSISDESGIIATSYKVLRHDEDYDSLIPLIEDEIKVKNVGELVLGLPKNMNNSIGERGEIALAFKEKLESLGYTVHLEDERLTTKLAENMLIKNDTSRKKRKKVIDGVAATIILQSYLDRRKRI